MIEEDKLVKAKVIEGMLGELGMSRQELIDLIKILTEQSVSKENDTLDLDPLPENLGIEQLAIHVAEGNSEYLAKYLSLEQLQKLQLRVGLAFSLKRAIELGIVLDPEIIAQLAHVRGINKFLPAGTAVIQQGNQRHLSPERAAKLSTDINNIINQRQVGISQTQVQQLINDPNAVNNPNASVNLVKRVLSAVGGAAAVLTSGGSLVAKSQMQQQQQIQNVVRNTERAFRNMRRHERAMRNAFPQIGKMNRKGGEIMVSIRSPTGGEREMNLRDFLKESGKLTPKVEKLLNKLVTSASEIARNIDQLSRGLPEAKSFQFDAAGRMQVQKESEGKLKLVNISDYLHDIKNDINKLRSKANEKKEEIKTLKKQETTTRSEIERAKDLTRGPELDNAQLAAAKIASEHENSLKFVTMQPHEKELSSEKVEKKEIKRAADELVKLDALTDKQKMLEAMKATGEMKHIESSMKEAMKHMDEAEKNKDLLKELQLAKKDKFLDK